MNIEIHRISALIALPSRRSWGEAWWTARDICLTNEPELPDPLKTLVDAFWRRLDDAFINGTAS